MELAFSFEAVIIYYVPMLVTLRLAYFLIFKHDEEGTVITGVVMLVVSVIPSINLGIAMLYIGYILWNSVIEYRKRNGLKRH